MFRVRYATERARQPYNRFVIHSLTLDPSVSREGPLAASTPPLLEAQNVRRTLGSGETSTLILKGVNLSIKAGEYASIVGASGSGKSTLLYLLGGLDRPTQTDVDGRPFDPPSRVLIDGRDTTTLDDTSLALVRNEKVGFVFQFHYLLKEFTTQENVCLPMFKLGKLSRGEAMERGAMLLKQFGLGDKIKRRANKLSGGEQQRVAIARALANEPRVVLADEPTGNLDRKNGDMTADLFDQLHANGQAIVMVTHDTTLALRADRIITMEDGKVLRDQSTGDTGARA